MIKKTIGGEAFAYMVGGLSVIPVDKNTKKPLVKWEEFQTKPAEDDQIMAWYEQYPEANVGIITGEISGITVIDIDVKHDEKVSLDAFPETYTVRTPSGGFHLYYEYDPSVGTSANIFPQFPHVDIRNDGGYVVAPPSITEAGAYEVFKNVPRAKFPAELFAGAKKRKKGMRFLTNAGSGSRNDSMASFIGHLLTDMREDKWATDAWAVAVDVNKTYKPPLSDDELRATFESIANAERSRRAQFVPSPIQIDIDERIEIQLRKNKNNTAYKDMVNVLLVLQGHPLLKDKIKFNAFRHSVEYEGHMLSESDLLHIHAIIQDTVLPGVSKQIVDDAVNKYAFDHTYDEALDWVKSLQWDGTPRLKDWLVKTAHLEDNLYNRSVGAQWFLGMMKRLVSPGCIFDYVLVLIGPQGVGKTSLFRIIGGDWYKSYSGGLDTKDFYLSLNGAILVDLDEGVTLYRSESIKMKSMITQTVDEYRAPYARRSERYPRRFVFSMSTNDVEPFRDQTGNRRYWAVDLGEKQIDFKWLQDNRDQLYAEAYYATTQGIPHEAVPQEEAIRIQEDRLPEDEWTEPIQNYMQQSKTYCEGSHDFQITIPELYEKALKGSIDRLERRSEIRVGSILRTLGLERKRIMIDGERKYRYMLTAKKSRELTKQPLTHHDPDNY